MADSSQGKRTQQGNSEAHVRRRSIQGQGAAASSRAPSAMFQQSESSTFVVMQPTDEQDASGGPKSSPGDGLGASQEKKEHIEAGADVTVMADNRPDGHGNGVSEPDFPPPPPALLPPNEGPTPTDDQEPHRPWLVLVLYSLMGAMGDVITSAVIFVLLQSWGSVLAVLSAVGWTVFYSLYEDGRINAKLDFQFVSFALVFPVVFFVGETYKRREAALAQLATVKSLTLWIYFSHLMWVRPEKLPEGHVDTVRQTLIQMLTHLAAYLHYPRLVAREVYMPWISMNGRKHRERYHERRRQWRTELSHCSYRLSYYCEVLQNPGGLPGNLATRLNQYNCLLCTALQTIMNIKEYRTPQGMRTFARFYVVAIWPIMGPYFAWVKVQTGELAIAIMLALMSSLALAGLVNQGVNLEDPFDADGPDDIRVREDLDDLIRSLQGLDSVVGEVHDRDLRRLWRAQVFAL